MNKIIIVGHPSTPFMDIERLLRECGMGGARASRNEGFTPSELGATLLKAHGVPSDVFELGARKLSQLDPGPLWQSLVLDLMLGNIDQQFWGWSDSNAIHLLEYWKRLDPAIKFVFVYSNPVSVLTRFENDTSLVDPKALDQRLRGWHAFNSEMLHFFNRNADRSVLIHVDEARSSVKTYLQHVRTRLDAPLAEPPAYLLIDQDVGGLATTSSGVQDESAADGSVKYEGVIHEPYLGEQAAPGPLLKRFLAEQVVALLPEADQLYEDLQSVATLPKRRTERSSESVLAAWLDFGAYEQFLAANERALTEHERNNAVERAAYTEQLEALEHANRALEEKVTSLALINEALCEELHQTKSASQELHAGYTQTLVDLQSLETAHRDALAEHSQLLSQLLAVQEDLERRSTLAAAENEAMARTSSQLAAVQAESASNARAFTERLTSAENDNAELKSEYEQLFMQLRIVQEELELLFQDNRQLREREVLRNPPMYGAADRVKQQLTYRLGSTILTCSNSLLGWVYMPAALIKTTWKFRKYRKASANVKLPPISTYRDAKEAEKAKQHLSYRLGKAFLDNIGSPIGWCRLPVAMRRSVSEYQASRAARK